MPSLAEKTPPLPADLNDARVLTKAQACELTGLSDDTLERLHQRGEGPKQVRLSPKRVGYQVSALRDWLRKRST
jgi:predicted DNA-binding transcriptional regulator AlpA